MSADPASSALRSGFEKIDSDLGFLIDCLARTFCRLGMPETAAGLPWMDNPAAGASGGCDGEALSIAFQLLNLVEENAAAEFRRRRAAQHGPLHERGLWGRTLAGLREKGIDNEALAELLKKVRIEPVLTAHPTEAKRPPVLVQHRVLHSLIEHLNSPQSESLTARLRNEIDAALERLWRTGETHLRKPEVQDELKNILHYLTGVFPAVLPMLDTRLREALESAGYDAEKVLVRSGYPQISFGTWVGGDRDGHPFVTASVTRETLKTLRDGALEVHRRSLTALEEKLSLAGASTPPPEALFEHFGRPPAAQAAEPWKWFVSRILSRLPVTQSPEEVQKISADLLLLEEGLERAGAGVLARHDVLPARRLLETFGFHLARLDIRQNSRFHCLAISQLLSAAGMDGRAYAEQWSPAQRLAFLEKELLSPRPFLPPGHCPEGPEIQAVLDCYRVLKEEIDTHGRSGIGSLIVSMTTDVEDLLAVYLLAREAGLCRIEPGGLVCQLPVVPLFETLADLDSAPQILSSFLQHPITRRSLAAACGNGETPVQQVMIGYSDSCKDGGIFSSQWALHRVQGGLARLAAGLGVEICFFHGRGGTVSRGAGPTHRFLEALPHGSLSGAIRITEQGETIAQKYANLPTAEYNLELLMAGVTETLHAHSLPHPAMQTTGGESREAAYGLMDRISERSSAAYRALLEKPGFMEFYRAATPIDALELCQIGSRPSRRTGAKTLDDLRAIPWVFSWNQSRFYLPGWFGTGSALASLDASEKDTLRRLVRVWPFLNYALTNIESSVASSDAKLMEAYAGLVENADIRSEFLGIITAERLLTIREIEAIYGSPIETRRPRLAKTLALRSDALVRLHHQQIQLLREWRAQRAGLPDTGHLPPGITLSINAIASGLRTTG